MALETDLLIDRAPLKRRLLFWRVATVCAVVLALLVIVGRGHGVIVGPHIVRLTVNGIITDDGAKADRIQQLADDPSVLALLVSIDSPGGSVSGGEGLHDAIAAVAAKKPVVAVMRGEAASAGYMIAAPAARIFARESTITGSIGVLMQTGEVSGLLGKIGVSVTQIVSGPLKGQPDPTQPLSPVARDYLQGIIGDLYGQFVAIVADGRHMDPGRVRALADGRAYTGRQALPLGLVDEFGGEREARQWLARSRHVAIATPVVDLDRKNWWMTDRTQSSSSDGMLGSAIKMLLPQRVTLDGPLALWQPGG